MDVHLRTVTSRRRATDTTGRPTLRDLAAKQFESPLAVSFTLDLDPSETPTVPAAATRVDALLDQAMRRLDDVDELSHHEAERVRAAVARGVGQLRTVSRDDAPVHGLAVYASADGYARTFRLAEAVPDRAVVATTFRVRPVAAAWARSTDALLVHVGRELGRIHLLTTEVHGRHDQGGWSQARYSARSRTKPRRTSTRWPAGWTN